MKISRRIALIAGLMLAMTSATAQYTASFQIVVTGNCFSGASSTAMNNIRQIINQYNAQFQAVPLTKEECMTMSQILAGEIVAYEFSEYGCSIKIIVTPCICTRCQDEATPGPDQGGSYYSTNPGNEVRDWEADVERRNQALNNGATPPPSQVEEYFGKGSVDIRFNNALQSNEGMSQLPGNAVNLPSDFELLANMENVKRYLDQTANLAEWYIKYPDPDHLVQWFHDEFARVSGFNVDEIMNKLPSQRSEAEKQALLDYQAYRRQVADKMLEEIVKYIAVQEETRIYEMAVLSGDCYGDSEHQYIGNTNYQAVNISEMTDPKMREWAEFIERCNKYDPGFNAVLYKNKVTGEYTLAFEGSNFHPADNPEDFYADWIDCNLKQGLGDIPVQYILAKMIADRMPKDVQINYTGHSLAGGLASVAGAASGAPTYTYNAEGVNQNIISEFDLTDKIKSSNNDIKAFQANDDPLTRSQEGDYKPIILGAVTIVGVTSGTIGAAVAGHVAAGAVTGEVLSPAIGEKTTVENNGGHSILPMIDYLEGTQRHFNAWKSSIYEVGYGNEQQTEDHILIIWQNEE